MPGMGWDMENLHQTPKLKTQPIHKKQYITRSFNAYRVKKIFVDLVQAARVDCYQGFRRWKKLNFNPYPSCHRRGQYVRPMGWGTPKAYTLCKNYYFPYIKRTGRGGGVNYERAYFMNGPVEDV